MKKLIAYICAASATFVYAQKFGNFEVDKAEVKLGTMNFRINYYDQNWNGFGGKNAVQLEGFPKTADKKFYEAKADFVVAGKKVGDFSQRINFKSEKKCELIATFAQSENAKPNDISYVTAFPIKDSTFSIDNMTINLEESKNMQKVVPANLVTISSPAGVLKISGKFNEFYFFKLAC